jgi:K+-sensing histidine kinase KdpD
MASSSLWPRFQKYFLGYDDIGFSIDISRMRFADDFFAGMVPIPKTFSISCDISARTIDIFAMTESESAEIQLSMPELVKFIRQLAHDLRNHLNAAELQSAYLLEIAENNELRDEIKRLRGMISQVGSNLQGLTTALSQPRLTEMPYEAKDLIEDLQQKISTDFPDANEQVKWEIDVGETTLNVDPQLLLPAFAELFANAFRHERAEGSISVTARTENGRFIFTLSEPKKDFSRATENWGREPFRSLGQGHYGLGLHRTRAIIEAHGGEFAASHDAGSSSLVTTVALPLAARDT